MMSLTYTVYLWTNVEIKEPEAESDTHASFESGFRNNSIVQNNNYSFYNYQNTPSFLSTSLYFFCVFWTSTICSRFHTAPGESREEVCVPYVAWPPLLVTSDSPSSATLSNVLHLCSVTWLSHVVRALQGQQVFSWVTRTYMERHVCYTISYSKLACGIEKGGGLEMGFGGTQNVSTWLSLLAPSSPFFSFFFFI